VTKKQTKAPIHPVPDSKGAKRNTSATPDKPAFIAELQSLSVDELIQKAQTLDATATSAWMPRALTLAELFARERLSELPGRRRTARLRELASRTRIGLKTVRQDLRICEVFFADEAKAADWLAREPVCREAFVTALVHPRAIEQAYDASVRGEYDRAAFRRYVRAQVAAASGTDATSEQKGPTQRLRGLPPPVRAALEWLKGNYPDLSETDLLLKALDALRQRLPKGVESEGEKKKPSRKSQRGQRTAAPSSQGEPVAETTASLFATDGQLSEGAASPSAAPKARAADTTRCPSPEAAG
jgi:hypothetical protein